MAFNIDPATLDLEETVIETRRVSKTVKGGRIMRFAAVVVVGDKNGHVGYGTGKSAEVPEAIRKAIEDAKINASNNNITNCDFYAGDMKDILTDSFVEEHGRPDVIILDPPRAGIHPDVAQVILNAAPDRMVYVSCNPASQARDLEILCKDYVITAVRPVDMFPHTHHVENVVALKRR